jgi:hypothetical protein
MKSNRRQFTRNVAIGAGALLLPDGRAGEPQPAPPDPTGRISEGLLEVVRALYGRSIAAADIDRIRGKIRRNVGAARALGRFPLTNGDEPASVFSPDV